MLKQFLFILTSTRQPTPVVLSTDTAQFSQAVVPLSATPQKTPKSANTEHGFNTVIIAPRGGLPPQGVGPTAPLQALALMALIRGGGAPLALLAASVPPPRLPPEAAGPAPLTC